MTGVDDKFVWSTDHDIADLYSAIFEAIEQFGGYNITLPKKGSGIHAVHFDMDEGVDPRYKAACLTRIQDLMNAYGVIGMCED